ncbi:MAG: hypothetical protein PHN78_04910 [Dehalococcoidales bacterium]|nr:hypothetical protein [Dehalococcoidales bacterium]
MKSPEQKLISFTQSIPNRCTKERNCLLREGPGTWDTRARREFAKALDRWFLECFPSEEPRNYIYVEGVRSIPTNLRGREFFGTTMHPDAAIIIEGKPLVAVELDHGNNGSQIRNALAKAGFSVLLGRYDQAMVLFFADKQKIALNFGKQMNENKVLKFYKEHLNTTLLIL